MGQVIQMFPKPAQLPDQFRDILLLMQRNELASEIHNCEVTLAALEGLANSFKGHPLYFTKMRLIKQHQHRLDCLIAEYTGTYGPLPF